MTWIETSHSQSPDSVERANQDVQNIIMTMMQTNKLTHWAESLTLDSIHEKPFFSSRN